MRIYRFEKVTSTQDVAKELLRIENPPFAVIARLQLYGRGREGRRWLSPLGGFWATIVFDKVKLLQFRGALAVLDACKRFGVTPEIKWPNDVVYNRKKLAGILVESCSGSMLLGVGVNVNNDPPIQYSTSMKEILKKEVSLKEFEEIFFYFLEERISKDNRIILEDLRRSCGTIGEEVVVKTDKEEVRGKAIGIGEMGELLILSRDGEIIRVFLGEVHSLRTLDKFI